MFCGMARSAHSVAPKIGISRAETTRLSNYRSTSFARAGPLSNQPAKTVAEGPLAGTDSCAICSAICAGNSSSYERVRRNASGGARLSSLAVRLCGL